MIYTVSAQRNNSSGDAKAMRSFRKYINEKNQNHSLLIVPIHTSPNTTQNLASRESRYISVWLSNAVKINRYIYLGRQCDGNKPPCHGGGGAHKIKNQHLEK